MCGKRTGKLSTLFDDMVDIIREANFWPDEAGASMR
ncbi:Lon-insertion domain-containing protein [Chloroflexota bacterium]